MPDAELAPERFAEAAGSIVSANLSVGTMFGIEDSALCRLEGEYRRGASSSPAR